VHLFSLFASNDTTTKCEGNYLNRLPNIIRKGAALDFPRDPGFHEA
jgi:hypothetical protein